MIPSGGEIFAKGEFLGGRDKRKTARIFFLDTYSSYLSSSQGKFGGEIR
jgi:hypothetical protein